MADRSVNGKDAAAAPDPAATAGAQRLPPSLARGDCALDRGWHTLLSLRSWLMVGSGLMAVWSVRHPHF